MYVSLGEMGILPLNREDAYFPHKKWMHLPSVTQNLSRPREIVLQVTQATSLTTSMDHVGLQHPLKKAQV